MITFQLWGWRGDSDVYDLEHFQLTPEDQGEWKTSRRTATYRAYTRAHLLELATRAGLARAHWVAPHRAEYFQPVMIAVRPSADTPGAT